MFLDVDEVLISREVHVGSSLLGTWVEGATEAVPSRESYTTALALSPENTLKKATRHVMRK